MTTEANNTTERKALNLVQRIVANCLENENGKIQENMKALGEDFTYYLGWKCEDIYKRHLLRNFYRDMLTQLAHPDTTEESAKEYLRHTVEHLADDILHGSPTRHSTNAIENLAHTWEFETKQEMYNIAVGLHSQFED